MGRRLRCVAMILLVSGLLLGSTSPPWASPETQATSVHIVLWGETLGLIAQRYGVTSARMCAGISWRQQTPQNFAPQGSTPTGEQTLARARPGTCPRRRGSRLYAEHVFCPPCADR